MSAGAAVANVAWAASGLPAWRRFRAALADPEAAQRRVWRRCLRHGRDTAFARRWRLDEVTSIREFQTRVPLMTPDDLQVWTSRIAAGERDVLTSGPVSRLAPSSGSTAAVKLIPHTRELQRQFGVAVDAWVVELFRSRPWLLGGSAYWSVTPAAAHERPFTSGAIDPSAVPVGFDDDAAYLGGWRGAVARQVLAVPADVGWHTDLATFHDETLVHLVLAEDLRLMSVWHPSFLSGLLEALTERWDRVLDGVARVSAGRARSLGAANPGRVRSIWPRLSLVSCWADGPSTAPARALEQRLSGIEIQPKGLLATEGVVSIPFGGGRPVAVTSHFFEFLDANGRPRLVHELVDGDEYDVVLTTGGGLWRYRLGDRVRVEGAVRSTPSLRFVGRTDRVSDLVGEKLSDGFVAGVIERLFARAAPPDFAMLAPDGASDDVPGYALFVGAGERLPDGLASRLEVELRRNPHYAWAADLGQLRRARVIPVGPGAHQRYVERRRAKGQRLGDIKPTSLDADVGWREAFAGVLLQLTPDGRDRIGPAGPQGRHEGR